MSKEDQDGPDGKPCCNKDKSIPDGTAYPDAEDMGDKYDGGADRCDTKEDNEGTSCKINLDDENETGETMNLPFATEDGKMEVPLLKYEDGLKQVISSKEEDGFARIHNWDEYTREVLNNILIAIENKQHLGYFDSIIDLETNCNLINIARDVYINQFNEDGSKFKNPRRKITKTDIDKQNRGGYSVEFKERMYKLLVNVK